MPCILIYWFIALIVNCSCLYNVETLYAFHTHTDTFYKELFEHLVSDKAFYFIYIETLSYSTQTNMGKTNLIVVLHVTILFLHVIYCSTVQGSAGRLLYFVDIMALLSSGPSLTNLYNLTYYLILTLPFLPVVVLFAAILSLLKPND